MAFFHFNTLRKYTASLLNLFNSLEEIEHNNKVNEAIDNVKAKYGKNSLIKASSLLDYSTAIERNKNIGGHNA